MTSDQILDEIREANLSYLMLAQNLIRIDREQALFRLGISDECANLISELSPSQVVKIASTNQLLARFRFDDERAWKLASNHDKHAAGDSYARMHANIMLAGRFKEIA